MKIIAIDNYDRDFVADKLIEENVSEIEGKIKVEKLNLNSGENSEWYYLLVADDRKLRDPYEDL